MRPNFFVNTPDILHAYLQYGGPAAFKIRAAIAATGSPSWGVYAGYELYEHVAVKPGSEEYLDSEKYQIRIRDWDAADRRGPHARAVPHPAQRDPPPAPRPAAAAQRRDPRQRRRERPGLLQDATATAGTPSSWWSTSTRTPPARPPSTSTCPRLGLRLGRLVRGARRDHRPGLGLGPAQLRTPRPRPRTRAHPDREEDPLSESSSPVHIEHTSHPDPDAEPFPDSVGSTPDWFKTAVFYEVLVRSFRDSNGDGTGDFKGLTEKLDYLQWLGRGLPVGAAVLHLAAARRRVRRLRLHQHPPGDRDRRGLPPLPRRGAQARHPGDHRLRHEPHERPARRGSRQSRSDPDGPYGDFYVWSDTDELYQDARVIFVDTEPSNWTWDPVRQQYYWHRFFAHQPDLNFDNPRVHEAMLEAISFWFDMGLDGFRLDAVPYLYERPGTNGENLPETHEFLRKVRRFVDEKYPGKVLLAEANQWPSDVVDYFGDFEAGGDECHMCFHFPVMPRIFMAVRRESRFPISEILEQTPPIPSGCQWGIFLRNHDELTLEMVSDEDRDYMWDEYAKDPRMKANIGIRRRLAPLLDNDINQIELFTALLLSLPGSPVLYYGDEIGMGDNIWLGDRDGVRTPMQWTPDRNAGFSSATPGQAAPARHPGPGLRLPERQRRVAAGELLLAAALDPADDPGPPPAPGVRPRRVHRPRRLELDRAVLRARARGRPGAPRRDRVRQQPLALPAAGRARPAPLGGLHPGRAARRGPVPRDRRAAVSPDAGWVRLLLVPAHAARQRRGEPPHERAPRPAASPSWSTPAGSAARAGRSPSPASGAWAWCPHQVDGGPRVAIDLVDVTYEDGGAGRVLPAPAGVLPRAAGPARRTRSSGSGTTEDFGHQPRVRRAARPRGDGLLAALLRGPAGGADRWPSTARGPRARPGARTRRCSAASSRTPR